MATAKISSETQRALLQLKLDTKAKSLDEVIQRLLKLDKNVSERGFYTLERRRA